MPNKTAVSSCSPDRSPRRRLKPSVTTDRFRGRGHAAHEVAPLPRGFVFPRMQPSEIIRLPTASLCLRRPAGPPVSPKVASGPSFRGGGDRGGVVRGVRCTIGGDGAGEPSAWYVKKAAMEALALVEAFCLRQCPEEGACRGCPLNRPAELLGVPPACAGEGRDSEDAPG